MIDEMISSKVRVPIYSIPLGDIATRSSFNQFGPRSTNLWLRCRSNRSSLSSHRLSSQQEHNVILSGGQHKLHKGAAGIQRYLRKRRMRYCLAPPHIVCAASKTFIYDNALSFLRSLLYYAKAALSTFRLGKVSYVPTDCAAWLHHLLCLTSL